MFPCIAPSTCRCSPGVEHHTSPATRRTCKGSSPASELPRGCRAFCCLWHSDGVTGSHCRAFKCIQLHCLASPSLCWPWTLGKASEPRSCVAASNSSERSSRLLQTINNRYHSAGFGSAAFLQHYLPASWGPSPQGPQVSHILSSGSAPWPCCRGSIFLPQPEVSERHRDAAAAGPGPGCSLVARVPPLSRAAWGAAASGSHAYDHEQAAGSARCITFSPVCWASTSAAATASAISHQKDVFDCSDRLQSRGHR